MKIRSLLVPAVLGILLVAFAPPARAQASTLTMTFQNMTITFGTPEEPAFLPCAEVLGVVTTTLNGVVHASVSAKGTVNLQFTATGFFTFAPFDASAVTYSGYATQWAGVNLNVASGQLTATFHIVATGSDGSRLNFQGTAHFTLVGPDIIVIFGKFVCA